VNRACLVAGAITLAVVTQPGTALCQTARVSLGIRPGLTRVPALETARSEAGPATTSAARRNAVMTGAIVLMETTGGSVLRRLEASMFQWRPAVTRRFGFSVSRMSVLKRFSDRRTIEQLSPRLREASKTFRFTLRYAF
jgi:hypothetical protein